MIANGKTLVAVWKNTDIPLHRGQRLVGLRTATANRTIYLYDADGERPGWISGDVIDALVWTPSHEDVFIAVVMDTQAEGANSRFKVVLGEAPHSSPVLAKALRGMFNFPEALGAEPYGLKEVAPDLHKHLITYTTTAFKSETNRTFTMNTKHSSRIARTAYDNTEAFKNAAALEAGVIVNRQLAKIVSAKAPLMVRGYIDTPIGKVVLANLLKVLVHELRPDNKLLQRLSDASMEAAHLDLIRTIDLDGMIDELVSNDTIKRVMGSLEGGDA